jgi:glutamyl-tRNA synthetase
MEEAIIRWALKNALDHHGRAEVGPVLSKLLGERPDLRSQAAQLRTVVERIVDEVNKMGLEEQKLRYREVVEKTGVVEVVKASTARRGLPPLAGAEVGKVVTRLPPEPSGYMHLGHAMSGIINSEYAEMYDGKLWLRFEDTNPRKVRLEYYESFRQGYRWLGIEWDYEKNNSDDMELYYDYGRRMIERAALYACKCTADELHQLRAAGRECRHRGMNVEENLEEWEKAINGVYGEGDISFRLRGDPSSENAALRDPVLFRVVRHPHPLKGSDYHLWPTYDMAAAIQDAICGVSHVLRSSEFVPRDELQNMIRNILGLRNPVIVAYSRFEFKGVPTSKRIIRGLIEQGLISGWDDPRLTTIEGVRRRGILPETIREFTLSQTALTYAKREYDWSLINSLNRKMLDPKARRFFFVPDPIPLRVRGYEPKLVKIPFHPSKNMGERSIWAGQTLYISKHDIVGRKSGEIIRLKYLMNARILRINGEVEAEYTGGEPREGVPIIQWVGDDNRELLIQKPGPLFNDDGSFNTNSMGFVRGLGEAAVEDIGLGEVVQFERFGFCRRDSGESLLFIFCHE